MATMIESMQKLDQYLKNQNSGCNTNDVGSEKHDSRYCAADAGGVIAAAFWWRRPSVRMTEAVITYYHFEIFLVQSKPAMGADHSTCNARGIELQQQIDWLQGLADERSRKINTLESMLDNVRKELALSNDKKAEEFERETTRLRRELESEKANGKQLGDQLLSTATLLLGLQAEIRQLSNDAVTREKELQEAVNKLQVLDRENCLYVETLKSKLDDTKQMLDVSSNKVRQLETQIHEEKLTIENEMKKIEELEDEARILREELESEKATREEIWNQVSVLELEKNETMRDLDSERQRLRGIRETLMLQETQLQALDSTTELIQMLFINQLKTMQSTLEDEENCESNFVEMDGGINGETSCREKEVNNVGAAAAVEGNGRGIEQVLEIECPASHREDNIDLKKISSPEDKEENNPSSAAGGGGNERQALLLLN
ncbi:hypothetical protein PIB30_065243 [Stylosanthes scabra]|uniref:Uncharacterized protein n=1 Tax=Stylosanthes scabra TaxID=79078 RepID=A0ABU6QLI2_9FABA|nr:hypothetical protein [Stylosanthes scabra]